MSDEKSVLVHLGSGMGNMLMATPMLQMLSEGGFQVDLCLQGETRGAETLFLDWPPVRQVSAHAEDFVERSYQYYIYGVEVEGPTIPFRNRDTAVILHPMWDYHEYGLYSEIGMYTNLARCIVPGVPPITQTGCSHSGRVFPEIGPNTVVIAPGGQRHLSIRKWTGYGRLAERFEDVALVGVAADLDLSNRVIFPPWVKRTFGQKLNYQGRWWRLAKHFAECQDQPIDFPPRVKNYIGQLSLADTAALIAQAGCVIGNDCGLTHLAIALGKPTFVLVGPSSARKVFPDTLANCVVIARNFECQPCQEKPELGVWRLNMGQSFCPHHIRCMNEISVDEVVRAVTEHLPRLRGAGT